MANIMQEKKLADPALFQLATLASVCEMRKIDEKYQHYAERLREAMTSRNLTNEMLAERLGAHPVTVSKLRNGTIKLDDEWRAKIADTMRLDEEVLFSRDALPLPRPEDVVIGARKRGRPSTRALAPARIPLYGMAAGSMQGAYSQTSEPIDLILCPPGLSSVSGAYALKTMGTSMVPRYMPGDFLYVHPHQPVKKGDHVVVQMQRHEGAATETWIKLYEGARDDIVIVSQYNPIATIEFRKKFILHMHRVLPPNEIYGLS